MLSFLLAALGQERPTQLPDQGQATIAQMNVLHDGATAKIGSYSPQRLKFTAGACPEGKLPDLIVGEMHARLQIADQFYLLTRDTKGSYWFDANNNNDLTDDKMITVKRVPYKGRDGSDLMRETFSLNPIFHRYGALNLECYAFDPKDTARAELKDTVLYYSDYAMTGSVQLGDEVIPLMLTDPGVTGFTDPEKMGLLIDRNKDGRFDRKWEHFGAMDHFRINGTAYAIDTGVMPNGRLPFRTVADSPAAEMTAPPSFNVGDKIVPFEATTIDGKKVKLPGGMPGKVVMLDFWATWCGPCIGEIPHMKEAYEAYKQDGFEILGISLDNDDMKDQVQAFRKKHGTPWPTIYEGGGWKTRIGQMYMVDSIPFILLVDGGTGEILATEQSLRGPGLKATIGKHIAIK